MSALLSGRRVSGISCPVPSSISSPWPGPALSGTGASSSGISFPAAP
nr:MAG TPA: hypothetical protein [Caudoviricetes sp.]